jgi:hypothetical protein
MRGKLFLCSSTLENVAIEEFVLIQIHHDAKGKSLKLTQEDYWVKALERFKDFLPSGGPKERLVPLSPAERRAFVFWNLLRKK